MEATLETTLAAIIERGGEAVLKRNKVPCMTCPLAAQEINALTIGQVANIYGLDGDKIIKELKGI